MKIVTWDEYTKLLETLFSEVHFWTFDNIVAIGRGGALIAAYLASKMGVPTFCPTFVRHVGRGAKMNIVVHDLCQISSLQGRLLVVDDWLCEGRAMSFVLDRIPQGTMVKTLVMYSRRGAEFKPDFVGAFVEEAEREILFPYDALAANPR